MPDVFTQKKRSDVMSRIRGRGNKATELLLMRLLRNNHITGWRRHQQILGRPDFIFASGKVAIFVDGCFWHCCPRHLTLPSNNRSFWLRKLAGNRSRDLHVNRELRKKGWRVLRIWEHDLPKRGAYWARRLKSLLATRPSVRGRDKPTRTMKRKF